MLVEVQCDKFISCGQVRKPIKLHSGLNVVLGDNNGSNSIGKSTFLMILDFIFGGKDYVEKCDDVQQNVKEHTINFCFEFDGIPYYFSRNTVEYNKVRKCDDKYQSLPDEDPLSITEYCNFLREKYGVIADNITWRGAVSRFIRVYKRDNLDEERPLNSSKKEKPTDTIKLYMQLFKKYSAVEAQIKQVAAAEDEKETFRKSTLQYGHVRSAKTEKEKKENEAKIAELEKQEQELAQSSNEGLLDLDSMQAQQLTELNERLGQYNRQLAHVQAQLNAIRRDMNGQRGSFKRSFSELERFFPNESFHTLEEIEQFHRTLSKILAEEFAETESDLSATYTLINDEIIKIKEQIQDIKNIPNVSQAILKQFAQITTQLHNLREANKNFDELERLKKLVADYAETRDKVIASLLTQIETTINQKMGDITTAILNNNKHLPPELRLEKINSYKFRTPNDGGTGAQYRGLITFDLANMAIAPIPFLVHDSILLKNIEKTVFAEIIKLYLAQAKSGKQVFLAYDMLDAYDEETQQILKEQAVLELSPGGNELFGWAWNKEST